MRVLGRLLRGFLMSLGVLFLVMIVYSIVAVVLLSRPSLPESFALRLVISGPIEENPALAGDPLGFSDPAPVLAQYLRAIDQAAADSRVQGLILELGPDAPGLVQIQELTAAIARFRQSGKPVTAYADGFGTLLSPGNRPYLLATAADQIVLNPVGILALTGVRAEEVFVREALDRLGLPVTVIRYRDHKTALNALSETGLTPTQREDLQRMLTRVEDALLTGITARREISRDDLVTLMRSGPLSAEDALKAGLVDRLALPAGFRDSVHAGVTRVGPGRYLADLAARPDATQSSDPHIAVVALSGLIGDGGDSDREALASPVIAGNAYMALLEDLDRDAAVSAIVLRIDSGGGSPLGSEIIRDTLQRLTKPVVISMGEAAASGGYWIALGGDEILAAPLTLTGSIGVVGAFPSVQPLLESLGIRQEVLPGETAAPGAYAPNRSPNPVIRARMESLLGQTYQQFLQRVAEGRKLDLAQVEALAQGQVWFGDEALERRLIDRTGLLGDALDRARALAQAPADLPALLYPQPLSFEEQLFALLQGGSSNGAALQRGLSLLKGAQALAERPLALDLRLGLMP